MSTNAKQASWKRRKKRIRKKVRGDSDRPRMTVYKSNKHTYVQVIDDDLGVTLASASTLSKEIRGEVAGKKKVDAAKLVGTMTAKQLQAAKISQVVFDRNGFKYAGRVAAIADSAREAGIEF